MLLLVTSLPADISVDITAYMIPGESSGVLKELRAVRRFAISVVFFFNSFILGATQHGCIFDKKPSWSLQQQLLCSGGLEERAVWNPSWTALMLTVNERRKYLFFFLQQAFLLLKSERLRKAQASVAFWPLRQTWMKSKKVGEVRK